MPYLTWKPHQTIWKQISVSQELRDFISDHQEGVEPPEDTLRRLLRMPKRVPLECEHSTHRRTS